MKVKKFIIIAAISCALLLAITLLGSAFTRPTSLNLVPTAQAQEPAFKQESNERGHKNCSPRTMRGTHGYSYNGTVMGKPIAAAGPITFDGYGALHATYNVNLGGTSFKGQFTGIYTVNDDCTGTVTLFLPVLGLSTNGSFVITQSGQETYFTGTDSGVAITGATKKL